MKDFLDWFIGRAASDVVYGAWQWLWGATKSMEQPETTPTAEENESAAMTSLHLMRESIERLEVAVSLVRGNYVATRKSHQECLAEIMTAKHLLAQQNSLEARLVKDRIVILEQAAAQFLRQCREAEENLCTATNQLLWEQHRAIAAQQQLTQASAMQVLNASLLQIAQQRDSLATDSVQSQFDRATAALELASEQQKVLAETIDVHHSDQVPTLRP
jgi:preprotein translocase subunit SecD